MEMTDDAVPTITRPMTQSSATSTSRSVDTDSCRPAMCTTPLSALVWLRLEPVDRRGVAVRVERTGGCAVAERAGVIAAAPPLPAWRERAVLLGPTPDASPNSPPPRGRSGG